MKFELVEKEFDGKKSVRWIAETEEGRFSAPEYCTKEQLDVALAEGRFTRAISKTGDPFMTGDGRPVFTLLINKVLKTMDVDAKDVQVSNGKSAPVLQDVKITYLD